MTGYLIGVVSVLANFEFEIGYVPEPLWMCFLLESTGSLGEVVDTLRTSILIMRSSLFLCLRLFRQTPTLIRIPSGIFNVMFMVFKCAFVVWCVVI